MLLHRGRNLGGALGVVESELDVAGEALAAGEVLDLGEQEGGDVLAVDAGFVGCGEGLLYHALHLVKVEAVLLGDGIGDEHAALEAHLPLGVEDGRGLGGPETA